MTKDEWYLEMYKALQEVARLQEKWEEDRSLENASYCLSRINYVEAIMADLREKLDEVFYA